MVRLSIIIVNYRSAKLIADCLRSIAGSIDFAYEVIIVDNASGDDSETTLLKEFPWVKWVSMGYNAGFARANNEGIRQSAGEVVLLLNPDTIILDRSVEQCFLKFIRSDDVACGVQLLFPDGSLQISGNYFMKGGLNHLLPLPYWGKFLKLLALAMKTKKPNVLEASAEEKVDWISGAFLMVKKTAIAKAGMMDEDFFLYAEEVEWCSRLKKAGELRIYGDLRIIHIQGETIQTVAQSADKGYMNLSDRKGLQLMVSNHLRIRKQFGAGWFFFQLLNFSFEIPVYLVCSIIDNLIHARNPLKDWAAIKGFAGNVITVWRLVPRILSQRPYFYKML
jgi:hypothetical protein